MFTAASLIMEACWAPACRHTVWPLCHISFSPSLFCGPRSDRSAEPDFREGGLKGDWANVKHFTQKVRTVQYEKNNALL